MPGNLKLQDGSLQPEDIFDQCRRLLESFLTRQEGMVPPEPPHLVRSRGLAADKLEDQDIGEPKSSCVINIVGKFPFLVVKND